MTGSTNIEYCLVQYVPNVVRDERISIAAIFIDSSDLENGFCTVSYAKDWQNKVHLLDPNSDLAMLQALLTEIRGRLLSTTERSDMIRQLEDSFSNCVQISQRRKCPVAPRPETIGAFARELLGKGIEPFAQPVRPRRLKPTG
jgi:Protein of unknown function (DUF3037)